MPAIGVTGGVATGKTTFSRTLCQLLLAERFDADQCSRDLLTSDVAIQAAISRVFGPSVFESTGQLDRVLLRQAVFADSAKRQALEQILHPAIRARWATRAAVAKASADWFCVDIPLLYENRVSEHFSAIVVVACSPETQRTRLLQKRQLTAEIAGQIIAAQLPLSGKMTASDHLIWNDSTPSCLDRQARILAAALRLIHV